MRIFTGVPKIKINGAWVPIPALKGLPGDNGSVFNIIGQDEVTAGALFINGLHPINNSHYHYLIGTYDDAAQITIFGLPTPADSHQFHIAAGETKEIDIWYNNDSIICKCPDDDDDVVFLKSDAFYSTSYYTMVNDTGEIWWRQALQSH